MPEYAEIQKSQLMESFKARFKQLLANPAGQYPEVVIQILQVYWQEFCARNPEYDLQIGDDLFVQKLALGWGGSDFAAQQCIKNPEHINRLYQLKNHSAPFSHDDQLAAVLDKVTTEDQLIQLLRQYRNQEMVRIIWEDLNRLSSMQEITADLSRLADSCVEQAQQWLYRDMQNLFGTPYGAAWGEEPEPQLPVVLAMGKLGAGELNLSSDIDLIFTYPHQGKPRVAGAQLPTRSFLSNWARD